MLDIFCEQPSGRGRLCDCGQEYLPVRRPGGGRKADSG